MAIADHPRPWLQPRRRRHIRPRQHQRRSPVVDAAGVASGDAAVLAERRAQPGKRLGARGPGVLVHRKDHRPLSPWNVNRHDLVAEAAAGDGRCRAGLAFQSEPVLIFAADAMFVRHILGGDAHVAGAERAGQRAGHHVDGPGVAHLLAPAGGGQDVGRTAHALGPADKGEVGIAQLQGLGARYDGLHARPAQPVDVHRGHAVGDARLHRSDAAQVHVAGFGVDDMAHHDAADLAALDPGAVQCRTDGDGGDVDRGHPGQAAAKAADGGADGGKDDDVGHGVTPAGAWRSGWAAATSGKASSVSMMRAIRGRAATSSPMRRAL